MFLVLTLVVNLVAAILLLVSGGEDLFLSLGVLPLRN